ncbi:hypothetical protein RchiOBHm_Chr2g0157341 [Rosa chinensis]|uniref:Uncharacterized protein n=1 Tax=Rosa chinensis TaxID=74649 RepID=A0A2P6S1P9_ROSCH|nr:hypothetical protein RchiOBHm_Chr2g0157341 [Rosa chinensis]
MCDQTLLAVANIFLRSSLCMNYEVNRSKSEGVQDCLKLLKPSTCVQGSMLNMKR